MTAKKMLGNSARLKHHLGALKKLLTLSLLAALTPACTWLPDFETGFDDPTFAVHPRYTQYEVEGKTRMQFESGGTIFNGDVIDLTDMGLGDHESDFGGGVSYGDGFSGLRFDALLMDQKPKNTEILPANYGELLAADSVRSEFEMQEYRFSYTAQVYEFEHEEDEWWVKVGIGPMLTYVQTKLKVQSTTTTRAESLELQGGIPFPAVTVRGGLGPFSATAMYAYNDDVAFGSDLEGSFQDVEVRAEYYLEDQDLTIFAGWRRLDVSGSKYDEGLQGDADYKISGVFLGLRWQF
ncbi:MAG: hypothetical protein ACYTGW_08270 [Planctomycetota bacterium]|jgi:hypothetical protein